MIELKKQDGAGFLFFPDTIPEVDEIEEDTDLYFNDCDLKIVLKNTLTPSGEYHKTIDEQYETDKTKWYTD